MRNTVFGSTPEIILMGVFRVRIFLPGEIFLCSYVRIIWFLLDFVPLVIVSQVLGKLFWSEAKFGSKTVELCTAAECVSASSGSLFDHFSFFQWLVLLLFLGRIVFHILILNTNTN